MQIELPVSSKLKVLKFGSLLDIVIISTKLANSTLNGVVYRVCQWV